MKFSQIINLRKKIKPYKIIDLEQGTEIWHRWRNEGIGASDAPAIMGDNPWKSASYVMKEKLYGYSTFTNDAMQRGKDLEHQARIRYQLVNGIKVRPVCIQSNKYEWLRASLDGLSYNGSSVLEIKCGKKTYHYCKSYDTVPKHYYAQLQHILTITGCLLLLCFIKNLVRNNKDIKILQKFIDHLFM